MPAPDARSARIGHGTDTDEEAVSGGGAGPVGEPREQDSSGRGRGVGLGVTTILGVLLIAIPVVWAIAYVLQAGASGVGGGFAVIVAIVLLACLGAGAVLLKGLFSA